jgi:hypothetical protein
MKEIELEAKSKTYKDEDRMFLDINFDKSTALEVIRKLVVQMQDSQNESFEASLFCKRIDGNFIEEVDKCSQ